MPEAAQRREATRGQKLAAATNDGIDIPAVSLLRMNDSFRATTPRAWLGKSRRPAA
jgi:hypothetical protein